MQNRAGESFGRDRCGMGVFRDRSTAAASKPALGCCQQMRTTLPAVQERGRCHSGPDESPLPRQSIQEALREAKCGTGSGERWCSPRHSARGPCQAPALRGEPIALPGLRSLRPAAQSLPREDPAGFPPVPKESPSFALGWSVTTSLPQRTGTSRPSTTSECSSSRKCAAGLRRPAELP